MRPFWQSTKVVLTSETQCVKLAVLYKKNGRNSGILLYLGRIDTSTQLQQLLVRKNKRI